MKHDLTRKATEKNCQTKLDWTEKKIEQKDRRREVTNKT